MATAAGGARNILVGSGINADCWGSRHGILIFNAYGDELGFGQKLT
jgi:hypothetical protein